MRFNPEMARANQEGGACRVFLTLATDVAPGRAAATRDRRLAARPEPSTLEGVLLSDPLRLEFMPLSLPMLVA